MSRLSVGLYQQVHQLALRFNWVQDVFCMISFILSFCIVQGVPRNCKEYFLVMHTCISKDRGRWYSCFIVQMMRTFMGFYWGEKIVSHNTPNSKSVTYLEIEISVLFFFLWFAWLYWVHDTKRRIYEVSIWGNFEDFFWYNIALKESFMIVVKYTHSKNHKVKVREG